MAKDKETIQNRMDAIKDALHDYVGDRAFALGEDEPELDAWPCEDTFGNELVRYGIYPLQEIVGCERHIRKRTSSPVSERTAKKPRGGRKMSISKAMVNFDLPSEASSNVETDDLTQTDDGSTV